MDACPGRYSKRSLNLETDEKAQFLLKHNAPCNKIAKFLTEKTGEYYNTKDVHNMYNNQCRTITSEESKEIAHAKGSYWEVNNDQKQLIGFIYQTNEMKENYRKLGKSASWTARLT
eukprot:GAHX01002263.1.p2 GENE.GAHX01002263.1~~GAHX01002263.1.p2  ORF type:complete len:116 (-),score=19.10 GAHX01002263.1:630-977(-)